MQRFAWRLHACLLPTVPSSKKPEYYTSAHCRWIVLDVILLPGGVGVPSKYTDARGWHSPVIRRRMWFYHCSLLVLECSEIEVQPTRSRKRETFPAWKRADIRRHDSGNRSKFQAPFFQENISVNFRTCVAAYSRRKSVLAGTVTFKSWRQCSVSSAISPLHIQRHFTIVMYITQSEWRTSDHSFHTSLRKFPSCVLVYKNNDSLTKWVRRYGIAAWAENTHCHWILLPTLVPRSVKNDWPWSAIDITDLVCSPGRVEFSRKIHDCGVSDCLSLVSRRLHVNFTLTDCHFLSAEGAQYHYYSRTQTHYEYTQNRCFRDKSAKTFSTKTWKPFQRSKNVHL